MAFGVIQDALAEAEALRGDFEEFVGRDILDRAFERHLGGRDEARGNAGTLRMDVVSSFRRARVDAPAALVGRRCDDGGGANRAASRRRVRVEQVTKTCRAISASGGVTWAQAQVFC